MPALAHVFIYSHDGQKKSAADIGSAFFDCG
jgi:hypothetical protein